VTPLGYSPLAPPADMSDSLALPADADSRLKMAAQILFVLSVDHFPRGVVGRIRAIDSIV